MEIYTLQHYFLTSMHYYMLYVRPDRDLEAESNFSSNQQTSKMKGGINNVTSTGIVLDSHGNKET